MTPAHSAPQGCGPSAPDRSNPLPLWSQVCEDLRRRIEFGEFRESFPGEIDLTEQYDVSRHTVREALRVLTSDGLLERERGRGTSVREKNFAQNLGTLYSLFDTMANEGVPLHSVVLRHSTTSNASVAQRLELPPAAQLVVVERIRYAHDEPLAWDTSWLPSSVAQRLLDADLTREGLYEQLRVRCNALPDSGRESISAQSAPAHVATKLGLPLHSPVLYLERLSFSLASPIEWRETYIRGDRFEFEAQWNATESTAVPLPQSAAFGFTPTRPRFTRQEAL